MAWVPSVLVVDDDPSALELLRLVLRDLGWSVETCEWPRAALRRLEGEPPDLLIADLRMPELTGLELIRAGRARHPELCCLLVTGFATDEVVAEAFEAGVQDLLQKPVQLRECTARLRRACEVVGLRREVARLRAAAAAAPADPLELPRTQELAALPALPGLHAPVDVSAAAEASRRLERLSALVRQGAISAAEFEEQKRGLLARL